MCLTAGTLEVILDNLHNTIRKHSFSAPSHLSVSLLDDCLVKVKNLSGQVSQLVGKARNQQEKSIGDSPVDLVQGLLDDILAMVVVEPDSHVTTKSRVRVCHQCHAPTDDPAHVGIPCGVDKCSLDHWKGCEGGIKGGKDGHGKLWVACSEDDSTDQDTESEPEDMDEKSTKSKKHLPANLTEAVKSLEKSLVDLDISDSESEDEELRAQRDEVARLKKEVDEHSLLVAARAAKKLEKQQKKVKEKEMLAREMQMLRDKQAALSAQSTRAEGRSALSNTGTNPKILKDKVAEMENRKARKDAERLAKQHSKQDLGVTMGGIRALPEVRKEVEEYITQLRSIVPSLSSDPTAGGFNTATFQPGTVHSNLEQVPENKTPVRNSRYVYVAELGQAIPMVDSLSDLPSAAAKRAESPATVTKLVDISDDESECSEDEFCPFQPEPGMRFSWRQHSNGRKYFKSVPIQTKTPDMVVTYQFDEATGNYEQILVPRKHHEQMSSKNRSASCKINTEGRKSAKVLNTPVYRDHRATHLKGVKVLARKEERQPSFVSGDPEKQGKDSKIPTLVQYARDCPVSWTSKVTTSSLNPILFSWAYIAELLATRTGQAPSLQDGELEARLQHFLSVLEVTLQTTTQSDFPAESWKVARLYHQKVQDKVDTGTYTWLELSQQWGTATLPHELMAANAELAPRVVKKRTERSPVKKKDEDKKRGLCFSWNSSDTRGKCKWEMENDGQKCNREHYCSWCKSELGETNFHQKAFCKKRQKKESD